VVPDESGDIGHQSPWRRLLGVVFGYDFFISYSWNDGGAYANTLAQRLRAEGFEVFLDRDDYASGDGWKTVGACKIEARTRLFLVVVVIGIALARDLCWHLLRQGELADRG
jgi:hypothetical protein